MDDRAILGSLVRELNKTCVVCGCAGESCTLEEGEKCVLREGVCSNPRCQWAHFYAKKRYRRDRDRAARAEAAAAGRKRA